MKKFHHLFITAVCVLSVGCAENDGPLTTDMHEDFDHTHKHQHSENDTHEHEHTDNFEGSHSHPHSHSHRHGDPIHGGRIVSIGHTHHQEGVTQFHAEVLPITGNTIRFHILRETDDGEAADYPIPDKSISAIVSRKGQDMPGTEFSFEAVGGGETTAEFALAIPENFSDSDSFAVLIPKVKLNGNRQNFSFSVSRSKQPDEATNEEAAQDSTDE